MTTISHAETTSGTAVSGPASAAPPRQPVLVVDDEGPVAHLQLNRPGDGNALNGELLDLLADSIRRLYRQPSTRVIVLSGAGDAFCSGADVPELTRLAAEDPRGRETRRLLELGRAVCGELAAARAVTVARLHGKVIGAGLILALHCDLRLSADTATFQLPELALGIAPVWGGAYARLSTEIGTARLREMIFLGDAVDTATATAYGITHRAVPEPNLDDLTTRWSRRLARRDPNATQLAKHLFTAAEATARLGDLSTLEPDLFQLALLQRQHTDRNAPAS